MYNEEIKSRFISEFTPKESRRDAAVRFFNLLEPYEVSWDADICTVDVDKLNEAMRNLVGARATSQRMRISILKQYAKWCITKGVDGACDAALQLDFVETDGLRRRTVKNPQHLEEYLERVFGIEPSNTVDVLYRCLFWLAYSGVELEDAVLLKKQDFYLGGEGKNFLRYKEQILVVYDEAIPTIRKCMELEHFDYKKSHTPRVPGNLLLRPSIRSKTGVLPIENTITRLAAITGKCGSTDVKLTYSSAWLSGLFYQTYCAEQKGLPLPLYGAATTIAGNRASERNLTMPESALRRNQFKSYEADYERWKQAYSL